MAEEAGSIEVQAEEAAKSAHVYTVEIVGYEDGRVEIQSEPILAPVAILGLLVRLVRQLGG